VTFKGTEPNRSGMELQTVVDDRSRLARLIAAGALAVAAIGSLRNGKRLRGALAGAGAVVLGYKAVDSDDELTELDVEPIGSAGEDESADEGPTDDDAKLRCAACGEPIVVGQARGPNANDEIVHEACEEAA